MAIQRATKQYRESHLFIITRKGVLAASGLFVNLGFPPLAIYFFNLLITVQLTGKFDVNYNYL